MAAHALGMNKIVSEDALRRTLERIDEASSTAWMRPALMHSVRQALDVQVTSGNQHTSVPAKAALARLLKELGDGPDSRRPTLVRGDSGYVNEGILLELERRNCKCRCREGIGNLCAISNQHFAGPVAHRPVSHLSLRPHAQQCRMTGVHEVDDLYRGLFSMVAM